MHLLFLTWSIQCLNTAGSLAFRRCRRCLEMETNTKTCWGPWEYFLKRQISFQGSCLEKDALWNPGMTRSPRQSSDRAHSVKAVKKWLLWDAHSVRTSSCCWHAAPSPSCLLSWERVFSAPLFHGTATDDCDVSLFSRLDILPSFSVQNLFYGPRVAALAVLHPAAILVRRCPLCCSPPGNPPSCHHCCMPQPLILQGKD